MAREIRAWKEGLRSCLGTSLLLLAMATNSPGAESVAGEDYQALDVEKLFGEIIKTYQLVIHTEVDKDFFPPQWLANPVKASADQIEWSELERYAGILKTVFEKYSPEVIYGNINALYFASDIRFYGVSYGATNCTDSVYLCSRGVAQGFTDDYLTEAFHREFNSVLMRKFKFPKEQWSRINPPDFHYQDNSDHPGVAAIQNGSAWTLPNHKLYQQGFLDEYSKSALVKDVNGYTGMILTKPKEFNRLRKLFPQINEKFKIWLEYYHAVDPKFTEENLLNHP